MISDAIIKLFHNTSKKFNHEGQKSFYRPIREEGDGTL